jgi:hypothetical protein
MIVTVRGGSATVSFSVPSAPKELLSGACRDFTAWIVGADELGAKVLRCRWETDGKAMNADIVGVEWLVRDGGSDGDIKSAGDAAFSVEA